MNTYNYADETVDVKGKVYFELELFWNNTKLKLKIGGTIKCY